jgi:hypothetical protein
MVPAEWKSEFYREHIAMNIRRRDPLRLVSASGSDRFGLRRTRVFTRATNILARRWRAGKAAHC